MRHEYHGILQPISLVGISEIIRYRSWIGVVLWLFLMPRSSQTQQVAGPVNIKVDRVMVQAGTQYQVYLPTFEFNVSIEKGFTYVTSSFFADYDFTRGDMGFGLSHRFHRLILKPEISVEDNLIFRSAFSATTGVWRRMQGVRFSLTKALSQGFSVHAAVKKEKQKSPDRSGYTRFESVDDRTILIQMNLRRDVKGDSLQWTVGYVALEQGFHFLGGDYFYKIISIRTHHRRFLSKHLFYMGEIFVRMNVTDEESPYFFLGGPKSLRGFDNDEFWGKRKYLSRNALGVIPFPDFRIGGPNYNLSQVKIIGILDLGGVRGGESIVGEKKMTHSLKVGEGGGIGAQMNLGWLKNIYGQCIIVAPASAKAPSKIYLGLEGFFD